MDNNTSILRNVPFDKAEVKVYSSNYKKEFTYSTEQNNTSTGNEVSFEIIQPVLYAFGETNESRVRESRDIIWTQRPKLPKDAEGKWQHRYLPTSRLYLGSGINSFNANRQLLSAEQTEDQLDLYFAYYLRQLWTRYSNNILSRVGKAQENGLASIFKAFLSAKEQRGMERQVDPEVAYKRVADFLRRQGSPRRILGSLSDFEERYANDSSFRSVVNDINEVEARIDQAMSPRENLQEVLQGMFSGNKKVLLGDNNVEIETVQKKRIGLNTLSSGEKHLLRILIDTLSVGDSSILIDEPEISMHIDWQRQLINAMRQINPSAQLIIATHSPEIMAEVSDDRIFRL